MEFKKVIIAEGITTIMIEEQFQLAKGSVTRDISRGKFKDNELKKVGRDWIITVEAAKRLYDK